jgi:ABC-type sugar transport system ATPase subunit
MVSKKDNMINSKEVKKIISFHEISKNFGGIHAVNKISFNVLVGEVHGLVGENGAGKSTLVKIIGGVYPPDGGEIVYDGETVSFHDPKHSEELGIRVVHQEVPICLNLTVAESIFLTPFPPRKGIFVDRKSMVRISEEILKRLGINLNPKQLVSQCSPAQRQLILIAKALAEKVKFVIMDEPTSSLSESEVKILFSVIRKLQKQGETFLFISHRLNEVIDICNRITVMRNGEYIDTMDNFHRDISIDLLTEKILGKEVKKVTRAEDYRIEGKKVVLEVRNLSQESSGLKDISFKLHQGEILGVAGFLGAGRTELLRCLFGVEPHNAGEILLNGKPVFLENPKDAIEKGIGFLCENRNESIYYDKSIWVNVVSAIIDRLQRFGFINKRKCLDVARKHKEKLRIEAPSIYTEVFSLSGGNQQKVVLSRWLLATPKIFLLDEPTRGIDIGAKMEIRNTILDLSADGISVIYVSLDFDELIKISDRILVMSRGCIVKELSGKERTIANLVKSINASNDKTVNKTITPV